MRRIVAMILLLTVLILSVMSSFAQPIILTYDGGRHEYKEEIFDLKIDGELLKSDVPPLFIEKRTLVPVRAVFEKLGATVGWDGKDKRISIALDDKNIQLKLNDKSAIVNGKVVTMDVPAKAINERTMVPIRFVGEQLGMEVGWFPDKKLITIDKAGSIPAGGDLQDVQFYTRNGQDAIYVTLGTDTSYKTMRLSNPDRIVVDFPNTRYDGKTQRIDINGNYVKGIRYAQFEETTARVVMDVVGQPELNIERNERYYIIYVGTPDGQGDAAGDNTGSDSQNAGENTDNGNTDGEQEDDDSGLADRGDDGREKVYEYKDLRIEHSGSSQEEKVTLYLNSYKGYSLVRVTDPNRIVLDIPNAVLKPGAERKADISGNLVKGVRYAQFDEKTVRVVFDVAEQCQYEVDEKSGKLVVKLKKPTYKNIIYHNSGDRVYFTLPGAKLTEGGEELKVFYTGRYNSSGKEYTITFSEELAQLGSGIMNIDDSYLESIEIVNDKEDKTTSIVFNAKEKLIYNIITRSNVADTAITLLKPAKKSDRLVVIDPGHGGTEPGAIYKGLFEKDLNLDIAFRLNALLRKKNVNTYMMREDDSFVGLYERAYIANNLNASLFLSIHNNAIGDPGYGGTMTLYYPPRSSEGSFNGKVFSQIIQNKLLGALGTKDRRIIERPNLVVLKATTMPASLAEIAFMTNSEDRNNLQKESFRQKAAEALCDSIIEALKKVN